MRFYVDADLGHIIHGWVVPDNPVAASCVAVVIDGERAAEIPARITDDAIRALGWHSTGQCRFEIEESEVPGLTGAQRLEVFDVESNILVYRRAPHPNVIQKKVVLVNTSIEPEAAIQAAMFEHFQQNYFGIGTFSEEVSRILFQTPWITSSLQSGAVHLARYEACFLQESTLTAVLIHDPFVEMATRLAWLQARAPVAADPAQRWRLGSLAEAAAFAAEFDLDSPKSLKRLLKVIPESVYHFLYNPLTRQCGTKISGERLFPGHSINAIEVLARVGVVGHRRYFKSFVSTLFDQLGIQAPVPAPEPVSGSVHALADNLRKLKLAQDMLVFDVAMSDAVLNAVSKAWTDS